MTLDTLAAAVRSGLASVGCRIPVEVDGDMVVARDVVVTLGPRGFAAERITGEGTVPLFTMPASAGTSAAAAAAIAVLSPMVARACEAAGGLPRP